MKITKDKSLHIKFFGPKHYFWKKKWMAWFLHPDESSSGGVGFRVPFFHICFMWGKK